MRNRTYETFREFLDKFPLRVLPLVLMIGWIVLTGLAWGFHDTDIANDQYFTQQQVQFAQDFNKHPDRVQHANDLLEISDSDLAGRYSHLNDPTYIQELKHVAATGDKFSLPPVEPASWHTLWTVTVPLTMAFWAGVLSALCSLFYCFVMQRCKFYIADLPWKRVWPWIFVGLQPLLWVPCIASRLLLLRHDERGPAIAS